MACVVFFSAILYAVPAVVLSALPLVLGRKRALWHPADSLLLVAPFVVRASLEVAKQKGEWNLPTEAVYLGVIAPMAIVARVISGGWRRRAVSLSLLAALTVTAVTFYFAFPNRYEN